MKAIRRSVTNVIFILAELSPVQRIDEQHTRAAGAQAESKKSQENRAK
jgi:hypothetical protein